MPITLFVEDLEASKAFYQDVFDTELKFEDEASAVFAFGGTSSTCSDHGCGNELIDGGRGTTVPVHAGRRRRRRHAARTS